MTNNTPVAPIALQISNISIRQDSDGRYCLNDLHKASGGELKYRPQYWLAHQQTKDLIAEIEVEAGIPASVTIKGGKLQNQGTYVVKELVYAYAMWISASFSLKVIRAYDALQSQAAEKSEPLALHDLRTKILINISGGMTTQQVVPYGSCIIIPDDLASLKALINTEVPFALLPDLLELVSQRMAREYRRLPRHPEKKS